MSDSNTTPSETDMASSIDTSAKECIKKCESTIRNSPISSIMGAAALGYLVRIFPITKILRKLAFVFLIIIRPLFMIIGAMAMIALLRKK